MAIVRAADYIIEFLEERGVKHAFTVTGGGSIFLCDALAQAKNIETIFCHHEQSTAIAAEAYARVKKHIGVSVVTSGPGGTNAITGVAGSWTDSVPHLVLSGQAFLSQTIANSGVRQLGVQEINIIDLVKPITKYAVMVEKAGDLKYHLEKAFFLAFHGRPGPVWLDLPGDVQNAKIDPELLEGFDADKEFPAEKDDVQRLKDEVSILVEQLKKSKRPLLHVGQGVKLAGAEDLFLKITEKLNLPFVTARNANDIVSSDHELYMGRPGTFPNRGANFCIQLCDVYLSVGTRLCLSQTGFNSKDYARNAFRCMVDIDSAELDKRTLDIQLKIQSDAKLFLEELWSQIQDIKIDTKSWISRCKDLYKKYPAVTKVHREQKKLVNSYHFVEILSNLLSTTDILVTDMGLSYQGTHQAFSVKKGQKFFTNSGFASMGWGLPAAIGAAFANSRKRVVCLSGEGGLMMNIQELAMIMHYNLPIKLFIYNNGGYLTIKQTQLAGFGGRLFGVDGGSGISFPDFVKLAQAHSLPVTTVDSHIGLSDKIAEVLNFDGPSVCELMMDPDQEQAPKATNRRRPDGSVEPPRLEDLSPFLEKEEIEANLKLD